MSPIYSTSESEKQAKQNIERAQREVEAESRKAAAAHAKRESELEEAGERVTRFVEAEQKRTLAKNPSNAIPKGS